MKQILINILVNLIPYYFVRFKWFRRLIYCSTHIYNPMDLELLNEDILEDYNGILDVYLYYEKTHLNKYNF